MKQINKDLQWIQTHLLPRPLESFNFIGTGLFSLQKRNQILEPFMHELRAKQDDDTFHFIMNKYIKHLEESIHIKYKVSKEQFMIRLRQLQIVNDEKSYIEDIAFEAIKEYHQNQHIAIFLRDFHSPPRSVERVQVAIVQQAQVAYDSKTCMQFVNRALLELSIELWAFYKESKVSNQKPLLTRHQQKQGFQLSKEEYLFAESILGIKKMQRVEAEAALLAAPFGKERVSTIIQQFTFQAMNQLNELLLSVLAVKNRNKKDIDEEVIHYRKNSVWRQYKDLDEKVILLYIDSFWMLRQNILKLQNAHEVQRKFKICGDCGILLDLIDKRNTKYWRKLITNELVPPAQLLFNKFSSKIEYKLNERSVRVCYRCQKNPMIAHTLIVNDNQLGYPDEIIRMNLWQLQKGLSLGFIHAQIKNTHSMISHEMYYPHLEGYFVTKTHDGQLGTMQSELMESEEKYRWWTKFLNHGPHKKHMAMAIEWMKLNNPLYKIFFCNWEILDMLAANPKIKDIFSQFQGSDISVLRKDIGLDSKTKFDLAAKDGLSQYEIAKRDKGMIFVDKKDLEEARNFYLIPIHPQQYDLINDEKGKGREGIAIESFRRITDRGENIVEALKRMKEDKKRICEQFKVDYNFAHPWLEEMIFPTLFPYGIGGYNNCYLKLGWTLKQYAKKRLLEINPFFRMSNDWTFFIYDRIQKNDINNFNKVAMLNPSKYKEAPTQGMLRQLEQQAKEENKDKKASTFEMFSKQLSRKHPGSSKYMKERYFALRRLINKFGNPEIFITLTLDEKDKNYILLRQGLDQILVNVGDQSTKIKLSREDSVPVVANFYLKCRASISAMYGNPESVFGVPNAVFEKVEFQERGAPHYHILLWIKPGIRRLLDEGYLIQAHMPENEQMRERVMKYQMHGHKEKRCFKDNKKLCRYGYPFTTQMTDCIKSNRWHYSRLPGDEMIVPFNPHLLMMFDGSHHISRLTPSDMTEYMAKYVAKVDPTLDVLIKYPSLGNSGEKVNEVVQMIKTRSVSTMSAQWSLLGLPIVSTHPEVKYVDINLPEQKTKVLLHRSKRELLDDSSDEIFAKNLYDRYLARPRFVSEWEGLTFLDFVEKSSYTDVAQNIPKYARDNYKTIQFEGHPSYYFFKQSEIVAQFKQWYPQQGEPYFYYVYMQRVPHYEDTIWSPTNLKKKWDYECYLRGVIAIDYKTRIEDTKAFYQVTSIDRDELEDMLDQLLAGQESDGSDNTSTVALHIEVLKELLDGDVIGENQFCENNAIDPLQYKLVKDIQEQMTAQEKEEKEEIDMFLKEEVNFKIEVVPVLIEDLRRGLQLENQMSIEQQAVMSYIYETVNDKNNECRLLIHGAGGTGKSHLIKHIRTLFKHCLKKKLRVTATTGRVAAMIQGTTIHNLLQINEHSERAMIEPGSPLQIKLENTSCILIDEVSMLDSSILMLIDDIMKTSQIRDQSKRYRPFGGCNIILMGDPLQLMPITKHGEGKERNSLLTSQLFMEGFDWIELTTNFRQKGDLDYAQMLQRIRYGEQTEQDLQVLQSRVCGNHKKEMQCMSIGQCDLELTATREMRENINQFAIDKIFEGCQETVVLANDFTSIVTLGQDIVRNIAIIDDKAKQSRLIQDIDDHFKYELLRELRLYIGMKVMITKNLIVEQGQTNGTQAIILQFGPKLKFIVIKNLTNGEEQMISPIKLSFFSYVDNELLTREQFPIVPAYACTVHKAQGLTLNTIKLHTEGLFAAGQFYTGISRIQNMNSLHLSELKLDRIITSQYAVLVCKGRKEQSIKTIKTYIDETKMNKLINFVTNCLIQYDSLQVKRIREYFDTRQIVIREQEQKPILINTMLQPIDTEMKDEEVKQQAVVIQKMKIDTQIATQGSFPWINWFKNSCLHDSFITVFYFTVWNMMPDFKANKQFEASLLKHACIELDLVPKEAEYFDAQNDPRQQNAIQLIRVYEGYEVSNTGSLQKLIQNIPLFCIYSQQRFQCQASDCGNMTILGPSYDPFKTTLEIGQIEWLINDSFKPRIKQQCPQCDRKTVTIHQEIITCPQVVLVELDYSVRRMYTSRNDFTLRSQAGGRYKYSLAGIVAFKHTHFVSYFNNGRHVDNTELRGWWRFDSLDKQVKFYKEDGWDPMQIQHGHMQERIALIVYKLQQ